MAEKYVLVTGAAKGIGRASALHLDKLGFTVFAGVRRQADGDSLCRDASPRLRPILLDVTDGDQIAAAVQQITAVVGAAGLHGLVNNAGVAVAAPLEFVPLDDVRWQLEVNVVGQLAVTQAFIPLLRLARGRVVNISSIGGKVATPLIGSYVASKFALEALTDALRMELKPWDIDVVAVQPGEIATPMWDSAGTIANQIMERMPAKAQELYGAALERLRQRAIKSGKNGASPQIVAEAVAHALTAPRARVRYLVGADARFVGRVIVNLPARLRDRMILSQG
ncbi:MAG: SDR family oxidoreductase [Anaerolinea sp.]|nr:SDR family oxidoreductase [Anaerolinea sp.]